MRLFRQAHPRIFPLHRIKPDQTRLAHPPSYKKEFFNPRIALSRLPCPACVKLVDRKACRAVRLPESAAIWGNIIEPLAKLQEVSQFLLARCSCPSFFPNLRIVVPQTSFTNLLSFCPVAFA